MELLEVLSEDEAIEATSDIEMIKQLEAELKEGKEQ